MFALFCERIFQSVLLLALVARQCHGHVSLIYPPARMYPLDFLNNMVTPNPCGMPKDPALAYYTDLPAGSSLQVFWDIPYPHRGGMFLELLNYNNEVLQRYPQDGEALADDVSQQNYTIQLPREACENCTLRIVKRGLEWGDNLLFWSCSDVNLVTRQMSDRQQCSNHGLHDGNRCVCDRLYEGDICQFQNDCLDVSDCKDHGQCVDTESTRYPRLACFCSAGWFGRFCERESPIKMSSDINLLDYTQQQLANNYTLYHRILADSQELEVLLVAKSVTWIALGWRSKDANNTCLGFPVLNFGNERNVSQHESTTPGNLLATEAHGRTPDECAGSCNLSSGCLYNVTWTLDPTSLVVTFTISVPLLTGQYFGLGFSHNNAMSDSDIVVGWVRPDGSTFLSDRYATGRMLPKEDTHSDLTLISGQVKDEVTVVTFSRPLDTGDSEDQKLDVPDCIYLLTARGQASNDNSFGQHFEKRPSSVKFCFNKCHENMMSKPVTEPTRSVTSSIGSAPDTTIGLSGTTSGVSDRTNGLSGTTSGVSDTTNGLSGTTSGVPDTTNGLSGTTSSVPDTTNGLSGTTRYVEGKANGVLVTTNFFPGTTTGLPNTTNGVPGTTNGVPDTRNSVTDGITGRDSERTLNSCDGSCTTPSDCLYNVFWTYYPATERVQFSVVVQLESSQYFGLGFSEDQLMPDSDIVLGWVRPDGSTFLSDRWASGNKEPAEDGRQDLTLISGQIVNGMTSITFSRAVRSSDAEDMPLNVIGCIYLLTAKGTKTNNNLLLYHSEKRSSQTKFCFNNCHDSTVPQPTRIDNSTTNGVPNTTNSIPDTTNSIPNTTNVIPDSTNRIPDTTDSIPNTTNSIPDSTNRIPDTTNSIPDSTNRIPDTTNRIPDTTNRIPDGEGSTGPGFELTPNSCGGSCTSTSDCVYNVTWTYDPVTDRISFSIAAQLKENEYFGLGFSEDRLMPNSDIIVGWVRNNGSTYLSDRWAVGRILPSEDPNNDLTIISGLIIDGVTRVVFSRLLDTHDSMDQPLNAATCIYLLTAIGLKRDDDDSFSQHIMKSMSATNYCFTSCSRTSTETRGESARRKRDTEGETAPATEANSQEKLQPMDCTDLIIGSARGSLSRIGDYYTRDRSTPLRDEVYGGSDSLTAALGFEENEFTTILFRKKLESAEMTDWSIQNELMHVIWARGQQDGDIYHNPQSAYERNEMLDRNFYRKDVLKYHGSSSQNRGVATFNFYDPPTSSTPFPDEMSTEKPPFAGTTLAVQSTAGPASNPTPDQPIGLKSTSTSEPPATSETSGVASTTSGVTSPTSESGACSSGGCTDAKLCAYNVTWSYNTTDDTVTFQINATVSEQHWISLGIMSQNDMSQVDVIVVYFAADESGAFKIPVLSDRHTRDRLPGDLDTHSDVQLLAGQRDNGVSSFTFKRRSVTGDIEDVNLYSTATTCPSLVYRIGGTVNSNGVLSPDQHMATSLAPHRVCFGVCQVSLDTTTVASVEGQATSSAPSTTTAAITSIAYTPPTTSLTNFSPPPGFSSSRPTSNESAPVVLLVPSSIKLEKMSYSSQLADINSEASLQIKVPIENALNSQLSKTLVGFKNVAVTRFSSGSVIVDFDVRMETKVTENEEVRQQVETAITTIVKTGSLSGHELDKNYFLIGEPRAEQISSNETSGLSDVNIIIIVVVVVIVLCLVAAAVVGYKFWTRRKTKSNMNQTRNGSPSAPSYAGNGSQSHAEMQESSRNFKEDAKWNNREEGRHSRGHDNSAYDGTQQRYQTYVA